MFGLLGGWFSGLKDGKLLVCLIWLVGWLVGCIGWMAHWLVQWFAGWLAGRVIERLTLNVILISSSLSLKEIVVSKWSRNPYMLGSWTDPVVGTDSSVFTNMAGRLKNLFFAGEATHADWYGFIQGAYYSGLDRANEIASCIKGEKCEAYQPSTGLPVIIKDCKSKASQMAIFPGSLHVWLFIFVYLYLREET